MPTTITHSIVGLMTAYAVRPVQMPRRFWILSAVCPAIADLDVIGFHFGIRYGDFLGHRGFSHSLLFAMIVGVGVVLVFYRPVKIFSGKWWGYVLYFFILTASNGLLDAFTNGGMGVALFSPFDMSRYFFPFRPIHVSPIGIRNFGSYGGYAALASELVWVYLPGLAAVFVVRAILAFRRKTKHKDFN